MSELLTEAIKEAYASAPANDVIIHTLEINHPDFKDDDGNHVSLRLARDYSAFYGLIEDAATYNPGEVVKFEEFTFDFTPPNVDVSPVPEFSISIDNVSQFMMKYLDQAAVSQKKTEVIYRPYLLSSATTDGPQQNPPVIMYYYQIEVTQLRVTGKARVLDVGNRAFPSICYTATKFPGLTR